MPNGGRGAVRRPLHGKGTGTYHIRSTRCRSWTSLDRHSTGALRTAHGGCALYHTKFAHEDAKLICPFGRRKTPDQLVHCRKTVRYFLSWPSTTKPPSPSSNRAAGVGPCGPSASKRGRKRKSSISVHSAASKRSASQPATPSREASTAKEIAAIASSSWQPEEQTALLKALNVLVDEGKAADTPSFKGTDLHNVSEELQDLFSGRSPHRFGLKRFQNKIGALKAYWKKLERHRGQVSGWTGHIAIGKSLTNNSDVEKKHFRQHTASISSAENQYQISSYSSPSGGGRSALQG